MDVILSSSSKKHGAEKLTRVWLWAMRVVLVVVFMGWLMMWIMLPTKTYTNKWNAMITKDTDSTFLGRQGTRTLVFAFPILFIAVGGCLYLHLLQISGERNSGGFSRRLNAWRRPVLVRGPLGVLSAMEIAFSLQFLALVIWALSVYISVGFSKINSKTAAKDGVKLWQAKLLDSALRLGLVGNICCAFLFFPVTRSSSLLPLIGLTSESSIKYHIWLGHLVMTLFSAHGLCFIVAWASTGQISQMLKWDAIGVSNVAGELALLSGLAMWVMTVPRIRRKMFELFFYSHQLYVLFLFFYLLHVGIAFFCYILPGVYLFLVDRFLRFLQSRQRVKLVSARLLPSESVELNFAKLTGFGYKPMSVIFVNVPSVSSLQWHPFTVSSSSGLEPEMLSVVIKKEGKWTQKLYANLSQSLVEHLEVSVEGPYGPVSFDFQSYESLVLISGGSGITPFISIIRELIHQNRALGRTTPSVRLICAFKTSADLTMLDLLLPISCNSLEISELQLRIEAFVTRETAATSPKPIRSIWFKPNTSDKAIAPVLGPNSWLWLAAIISSSFVTFLLLISMLTRFYIYPIDHNTNTIYPYTDRSLLNLLFICLCIALTASAAALWNKRQVAIEAKQGRIMDAASPFTSPNPWVANGFREIESVPYESLRRVTEVHYGSRPDLKRMILERDDKTNKGAVGVIASGPSELRHQVAEICSSPVAANLHYQSLSFTW
ncbi:hypothetical protein HPP92_021015 [Vanilla planifolia]|uniref:ferric-chelate reductase (NADH) n=1 Tax=Vanilla planifolia TaxID=51239 RepID=A0A835UGQ3_VANPL|nr:hypothetical protein HPP92_021015 [Vanilla planifolia]